MTHGVDCVHCIVAEAESALEKALLELLERGGATVEQAQAVCEAHVSAMNDRLDLYESRRDEL